MNSIEPSLSFIGLVKSYLANFYDSIVWSNLSFLSGEEASFLQCLALFLASVRIIEVFSKSPLEYENVGVLMSY